MPDARLPLPDLGGVHVHDRPADDRHGRNPVVAEEGGDQLLPEAEANEVADVALRDDDDARVVLLWQGEDRVLAKEGVDHGKVGEGDADDPVLPEGAVRHDPDVVRLPTEADNAACDGDVMRVVRQPAAEHVGSESRRLQASVVELERALDVCGGAKLVLLQEHLHIDVGRAVRPRAPVHLVRGEVDSWPVP